MIITIPASKDSYVTNLKNQNFDAKNANVGQAATLDFFKLHNENKNANSWALLSFTGLSNDEDLIIITDGKGNEKTFEFDSNGNLLNNENIRLDINGEIDFSNYSQIIKNAINEEQDLDVTAYNNSNNELLLKQNKTGSSGDTLITLPTNITSKITESVNNIVYGKFARIDYSYGIIKFDLEKFKQKYVKSDTFAQGAFNSLKAEIVMKDVTTGHTKPKDFDLQIFSINKDFNEGVGKDTIHFSDTTSNCNFINLNDSEDWAIPGFVSLNDDVNLISNQINGVNVESKMSVAKGNEDLAFDVTDYVKSQLSAQAISDKGFVIGFSDSFLYDTKSYFVKRTGSKHLLNKSLVPTLVVKIPDHDYLIPRKTFTKNRYLNCAEDFFLYNIKNGKTIDFELPNNNVENATIKLKIMDRDEKVTFVNDVATTNITNYLGEEVSGIKKASITNLQLSVYDNTIIEDAKMLKDYIKNNTLKCKLVWYAEEGDDIHIIIKEDAEFKSTSTGKDNSFKSLKSSVKIENYDLSANNCITECCVYFVDLRASHDPVKLPYDLPSQNIGIVRYQIVNEETGKIIVNFDDNTTVYYDGEKYIFNLCFSEIYKGFTVRFNFEVEDVFTKSKNIIYNTNTFKVK